MRSCNVFGGNNFNFSSFMFNVINFFIGNFIKCSTDSSWSVLFGSICNLVESKLSSFSIDIGNEL